MLEFDVLSLSSIFSANGEKIIDIRTKTTANANVAYAIDAGLEKMLFFSVNNSKKRLVNRVSLRDFKELVIHYNKNY